MNKQLKTLCWKEFCIDNLFKIVIGKNIDANKVDITNGHYAYITRKECCNGLDGFVDYDNNYLNVKYPVITIGNETAKPFVQVFPFYTGTKVNIMQPKFKATRECLQFICACIECHKDKYSYSYTINSTRLKKQIILLPVDSKGEPDYKFMEEYIKEHEARLKNQYKNYIKNNINKFKKIKLDTEWKEFFVSEIFNNIQRGKRLIKEHQKEGDMPYVSSTALNNGVDNFIGNEVGVRKYDNCLSLANSGSVGACFYEPYEFVASDHVTHLKGNYSKYAYLFMSCMLNRLSEKYNFNREINDTRIKREKVFLPVNSKGEPDYKFMEDYMKNLEQKKLLEYLDYIK